MNYSENKAMWRKLKLTLLMMILIIVCIGVRYTLAPRIQEKIVEAQRVTEVDGEISKTLKELESLDRTIEASGKDFVDLTMQKDNYVKAVGLLCEGNNLNIHKLTVGDLQPMGEGSTLRSLPVLLEIQGDLGEVKDFVADVYSSRMLCRINSFSYRLQDNTFRWMWRSIDDNNVVDWWDISEVEGYATEDPEDKTSEEDLDLLDANAFMRHGNALCYMEIQFIGTEG